MIDFHNHILPDVDDGPKSIEESMDMLRFANEQGITQVIQTVHFQHPKMEGKNVDYSYLMSKIDEVQYQIDKENLNIKMHLSAEVFYLPNLIEISDNPLLTIGGGKYMLIEFKTNIYPTGYEEEFFRLQSRGITPIVAHPERYRFIQNNLSILQKWIDRGYIIQVDAGSIVGSFGKLVKKTTLKMLDREFVHLVGSDAHNSSKRNFCLAEAYNLIDTLYPQELSKILQQNAFNIIEGKKIRDVELSLHKRKSSFSYKIKKLLNFKHD